MIYNIIKIEFDNIVLTISYDKHGGMQNYLYKNGEQLEHDIVVNEFGLIRQYKELTKKELKIIEHQINKYAYMFE